MGICIAACVLRRSASRGESAPEPGQILCDSLMRGRRLYSASARLLSRRMRATLRSTAPSACRSSTAIRHILSCGVSAFEAAEIPRVGAPGVPRLYLLEATCWRIQHQGGVRSLGEQTPPVRAVASACSPAGAQAGGIAALLEKIISKPGLQLYGSVILHPVCVAATVIVARK